MKIISWNVNGIRAAISKGLESFFNEEEADIFCIQETKISTEQITNEIQEIFKGYNAYWNSAETKGYSGTAVFTKKKPISVSYGIGKEEHDKEGRVITLEFEKFYLVNIYTPNVKRGLERLQYRMIWEDEIKQYLKKLEKTKPVIMCGDLNVAHKAIDLANPKSNETHAGYTIEERTKMDELINSGFIDAFRYKYPNKANIYTWWSYMFNSRERNIGWRIDYFITSDVLKEDIQDVKIYNYILGSDHCPIGLTIKL